MEKIKLFYSYSKVDEDYRKEIEKSLVMLKRYDNLSEWNFREILPGEEWDKKIKEQLEDADIILLLLSRDFLASTYCYDVEVKRAIEKHAEGNAIVVPIIFRECDWKNENCPFHQLEGLPKNATPISQWLDKDSAFNDITQRLKDLLVSISKRKLDKPHEEKEDSGSKLDIDILHKAIEVYRQESEKLDYNSPKEDFENYENLKRKLHDELIGKIDNKIQQIPALRATLPIVLFNRIYASEILDEVTIE